jgi:NACalpha-BTF3-like transcription factor
MSNEQIFETQEFHQEWRDLIERTGGDINRLSKPLSKPYKPTNHFKRWLEVKEKPDRINLEKIKQAANYQTSVQWEELRNRNTINGSQASGHINFSQPVPRTIYYPQSNIGTGNQTIAHRIYNNFGKKYYTAIRPPTEPVNNDQLPPLEDDVIEERDIHLVMAQVLATREQAVAALRRNRGDIVNAIMDLQN